MGGRRERTPTSPPRLDPTHHPPPPVPLSPPPLSQRVFTFVKGQSDGGAEMKALVRRIERERERRGADATPSPWTSGGARGGDNALRPPFFG